MLLFSAMPTDQARALQSGAPDAHGQTPERQISDGGGNPCRHCLQYIAKDAPMLVLAHRPFDTLHPYAETGPIFLCATGCDAPKDASRLPEILTKAPDFLIKGYGADDRIVYGTGAVVARDVLSAVGERILARADVAYVHVRSSRNNCYQLRIDRAA